MSYETTTIPAAKGRPARKWATLKKALHDAPDGEAIVVPVPEGDNVDRFCVMVSQALRNDRGGAKVSVYKSDDRKSLLVWERREKTP